jgi:LysR family hydrogen peroxide-inducible transcriptional activator
MPAIHRTFPRLKLYVREEVPGALEAGVLDGDYDMVLGPFSTDNDKLVVEPLFREPLLLAASSEAPLNFDRDLTEHDLSGLDVLGLDERHTLRREVERICERTGAHLNRSYEGTSLDTLRQMVVMGMGIAFLPALYVRSEIHRPEEIVIRPLRGGRLFREHSLLYRNTSPSRHFFREFALLLHSVIEKELSDSVVPIAPRRT